MRKKNSVQVQLFINIPWSDPTECQICSVYASLDIQADWNWKALGIIKSQYNCRQTFLSQEPGILLFIYWQHAFVCLFFSIGRPTCICALGFTGPNCGKPVCEDSCHNGGSCVVTAGNQPYCHCHSDYTGDRCQHCKLSAPHPSSMFWCWH